MIGGQVKARETKEAVTQMLAETVQGNSLLAPHVAREFAEKAVEKLLAGEYRLMNKGFEFVIDEAVRTHPSVTYLREQILALHGRYVDSAEMSDVDKAAAAVLETKHSDTCVEVRAEEEEFWSQVKPRRAFIHKRYITEERLPERCVITKLEYCRHGELMSVYYRTAGGIGLRTRAEPLHFRQQSFGSWAQ
jgi:hypothetical protein